MLRKSFFFIFIFFPISLFAKGIFESYINRIVEKYHFDRQALVSLFSHFKYQPEVIKKLSHPYEKQYWNVYRANFITPARIAAGVTYWERHKHILNDIEKKYGVPANIIVGMLGVETNYGEVTGTYPAFHTLATLAFLQKSRSDFFMQELTEYLLLMRERGLDAAEKVRSSYAGALGIPQFMPSVYQKYALSYNSNKKPNLFENDADAIISIANYLKINGWRSEAPIACRFSAKKSVPKELLSDRGFPHYYLSQLQHYGIKPLQAFKKDYRAAVIALSNKNKPDEYWLTFHNFKVIMSYNSSFLYAMSVYELSQSIAQAYKFKHNDIKLPFKGVKQDAAFKN